MGVIEALKTIKKTCESFECHNCPLGDGQGKCNIQSEKPPCNWVIKAEIKL